MKYTIIRFILFFVLGGAVWFFLRGRDHEPSGAAFGPVQEVLAFIEDEPVKQGDVNFELNLLTGDDEDSQGHELLTLRTKIFHGIIERRVLFKFIERDRFFDLDKEARWRPCHEEISEIESTSSGRWNSEEISQLKARICQLSLIDQYVHERVYDKIAQPSMEIRQDYYANHPEEFLRPQQVKIRQIVLADEHQARRIRHKVKSRNFEELAKTHSIAPESEQGGKLPWYGPGEMPSIFDIAFSLKIGQVSDVQKSVYGFHIIQLLDRRKPGKVPFEQVAEKISDKLIEDQKKREYQRWVELAVNTIRVHVPKR